MTNPNRPNIKAYLKQLLMFLDPHSSYGMLSKTFDNCSGEEVWMCTGDHRITAAAVADELGIPMKQATTKDRSLVQFSWIPSWPISRGVLQDFFSSRLLYES